MKTGQAYWTDPRERNYSARTIDELARFIIDDPKRIIHQIYHANALDKYKKRKDFFNDFTQHLSLYLFDRMLPRKFSGQTDLLLQWFNGSDKHTFSRWLVQFTHNQVGTLDSTFNDLFNERATPTDGFDDDRTDILSHEDEPFDLEHIRHLRSTDLDVLLFLLDAHKLRTRRMWRDHKGNTFLTRKLTDKEIDIYRRYLIAITQRERRLTLAEFAGQEGECPKEVARVVPLVGRCLKVRVKELDAI